MNAADDATDPSVTLPEAMSEADTSGVRARPATTSEDAPRPAIPSDAPRPVRSFASSFPPRPSKQPFQAGGPPPTVIRDLDALFAADRERKARTVEPLVPIHTPGEPVEPAVLAQALLDKVCRDFPSTAPPPPVASPFDSPAPRSVHEAPTGEAVLPSDDADLAELLPWHVRLWRRLFG